MTDEYGSISMRVQSVSDWSVVDEPLTGSRAKNTLISPNGDHFVFKEPKELREAQIWSEFVASFIAGDLLEWPVQSTSIARRGDAVGNLHGYVFDPAREAMIEGWSLCVGCDPEFDLKKGSRHTLKLIEAISLQLDGMSADEFVQFWGRALALDTLISNNDRHAENWATVVSDNGTRMAALYDNGTSFGCGIDHVGLQRWCDAKGQIQQSKLIKFRDSGRHHLRLDEPAATGSLFNELNAAFLDRNPETMESFVQCADLNLEPVERLLERLLDLKGLDEPYSMTTQRANHMFSVLQIGQGRLRDLLSRERIT